MLALSHLASVFLVAVVACSTSGDGSSANLPPLGAPLICDDPIGALDEVPATYRQVDSVVAFPADQVLQRGRTGPDNDLGSVRAFSKFGLIVRTGAVFQIHVAADSQANTLMQWGNTGQMDPVSSISVAGCSNFCELAQTGCQDGLDSDWVVYPGGVWTLEAACVSLVVLSGADATEVQLPVGAAC